MIILNYIQTAEIILRQLNKRQSSFKDRISVIRFDRINCHRLQLAMQFMRPNTHTVVSHSQTDSKQQFSCRLRKFPAVQVKSWTSLVYLCESDRKETEKAVGGCQPFCFAKLARALQRNVVLKQNRIYAKRWHHTGSVKNWDHELTHIMNFPPHATILVQSN